MKMRVASIFLPIALLALPLLLPLSGAAEDTGSAASGNFASSLGGGSLLRITFDAVSHSDGTVSGEMDFDDSSELPDQDVDGTRDPDLRGASRGVGVHAEIECIRVSDNVAVIGGIVTSSSLQHYVGKSLSLVVEDNGRGTDARPDRFTWGFYDNAAGIDCQGYPLAAYSFNEIRDGRIQVRP